MSLPRGRRMNAGIPAWVVNQAKSGFPNSFQITNIPGLALGRTYKVTGVALYS